MATTMLNYFTLTIMVVTLWIKPQLCVSEIVFKIHAYNLLGYDEFILHTDGLPLSRGCTLYNFANHLI